MLLFKFEKCFTMMYTVGIAGSLWGVGQEQEERFSFRKKCWYSRHCFWTTLVQQKPVLNSRWSLKSYYDIPMQSQHFSFLNSVTISNSPTHLHLYTDILHHCGSKFTQGGSKQAYKKVHVYYCGPVTQVNGLHMQNLAVWSFTGTKKTSLYKDHSCMEFWS